MAEESLKSYLQSEAAEGRYAGTGSFSVDLAKAMEKRAAFSLPDPGLWAPRIVQSLVRLGTTGVKVTQSRDCFQIVARLPDELPPELSLAQTFRELGDSDPRYPMQGGLLAALGRDYQLEVHWSEDGRRQVMSLTVGDTSIASSDSLMTLPAIEIHARPAKRGLLSRLFALSDFSAEFQELSRRTFLAPVPVTLDKRPCDFSTGFAVHFYPAHEFRGVRATSGPRLQLLPSVTRGLARPGIQGNDFYEPMGAGGYAFLLSLGWSGDRPRMSTACWIRDGVLVDEEPLFSQPSALHMTLFLPAADLSTDATGMLLRQTQERTFRLREARLWATTSLKTHLPPDPAGEARSNLQAEVEARMAEALEGYDYTRIQTRNFQDAIETHVAMLARKERESQNLASAQLLSLSPSPLEQSQRESVARWGRFLTYAPPTDELLYREAMSTPPEATRVKKFFGEVYVQLPGRAHCPGGD